MSILSVLKPSNLALEIVLFGAAALGLAQAGQPTLAGAFALLVALNRALIFLW